MQAGLGQWLHEPHGINLCFSTSSITPQVNPSIESGIRNATPVPSVKVSANSQAVRSDGGLAEGIEYTRKTAQKPKRKKHRPKVMKEKKAAKAQKSTTRETPKDKGNKPAGKRKYVRRKGLNTPTEQLPSEDAEAHTIAVPSPGPAKRCLNFDGKDQHENVDLVSQTQVREVPNCHGDPQLLTSVVERSRIQLAQPWRGTSSPIPASVDPVVNMQHSWANSRSNKVTFDLNNSVVNHIPSKFSNLTDSSGQNFQFGSTEQINQLPDFYDGVADKSVSHLNSSAKEMQNCSTDIDHYLGAPQSFIEQSPVGQVPHGYMIPDNPAVPVQHTERVWTAANFNHEVLTRVDASPQGYRIPQNSYIPPTCSERITMNRNLRELPVENDYLKFGINPDNQIGATFGLNDYRFSDVHAIGKKREYNAINGHQVSFGVNFEQPNSDKQFYNDPLSTSSQTFLLPETYKRMRSENYSNRLNGLVGKFSSSSAYPSGNWNINNVPAINRGVRTLADVQRVMALEKSKSSQEMIGMRTAENNIVQQHTGSTVHNTSNKYFVTSSDNQFKDFTAQHPGIAMNSLGENIFHRNGYHQLESLEIRPTEHYSSECFALPNEQSGYLTVGHIQLPGATMNPSIKRNYDPSNDIHQPQPLETQMVKGKDLFQPHKTSTQYDTAGNSCITIPSEQIGSTCAEVRSGFQSINQSARTENYHLDTSRETTSANPTEKRKVRGRPRKQAEPDEVNGKPESRDPLIAPLDYLETIIQKLNLLSINTISDNNVEEAPKNALVPYEGKLGALVPFKGKVKKNQSRAQVVIDPVTNWMWNLLMGPDTSEAPEGMDEDKERVLEEERRVFRGRIDSFIARMHLVQGDRRFSPWKGSVVDSVVGVFLTQNVSDHLSSSAFMALAAKFPAKSEGPEKPAEKKSPAPPEQKDSCSGLFCESIKLQGNLFVEEIGGIRSLNTVEDKEGSNSNELIGSSSGDGINRAAGESAVSYMKSQAGYCKNRSPGFAVPEIISMGAVEADDGSLEDVLSSQNSAVSPQNSSEFLLNRTYTMCSSSMQNFTEEDCIMTNMPNGMGNLTANLELSTIQDQQSNPNGKVGSSEYHEVSVIPTSDLNKGLLLDLNRTYQPTHTPYVQNSLFDFTDVSYGSHLDTSFSTGLDGVNISNVTQSEASLCQHPTASVNKNKAKVTDSSSSFIYNRDWSSSQDMYSFPFEPSQEAECSPKIKQSFQQLISSEEVHISAGHSFYDNSFTSDKTDDPYIEQHDCLNLQEVYTARTSQMNSEQFQPECSQQDNDIRVQAKTCEKHCSNLCENKHPHSDVSQGVPSDSIGKSKHTESSPLEFPTAGTKARNARGRTKKKSYDWDNLRKEVLRNFGNRQRSDKAKDTIDWEAVRQADVKEISDAIRERGMNNMLAERIKAFLNRLVNDHGSIDLEWLRDIEPDKAKDYLLSIRGLGLKSTECVRLLTLHHMAFPVDTNVARICVRLGWVPLQPLPESLQLHLLELARLALPGPSERSLATPEAPKAAESSQRTHTNSWPVGQLAWSTDRPEHVCGDQQPIIEEPSTPEPKSESAEIKEAEIEDFFGEDPDEIPTINLNVEEFAQNLKSYIQANNIEVEDADMSKALIAITPQAASVPISKLKNVNRLRTEHQVYELPDSHPLLEGEKLHNQLMHPRHSATPRKLIPCRTAMRGSFPLNGTYFQVNEVFADHYSSQHPIDVPRSWIWNLPRRTVYFGTSVPTIFRGLTTEEIQNCFWRGFVCVRGFDRQLRAPKPLYARLHFPASKQMNNIGLSPAIGVNYKSAMGVGGGRHHH
uniref:Demeter RRM-fold domain-containing protein n=1 Tax=Leersia perrieri TaxID=77586 RepID=A0A0D9VG49_9ORYZ